MSKRPNHPLTQASAHKRALLGWETRRKHNPHLRNVHKTGFRAHEWRRPNGEIVPLHGFKDREVASMAPAFSATDRHLHAKRRFNTEIKAKSLGSMQGETPLGATYTSRFEKDVPTIRKKYLDIKGHVPEEHWGHKNRIIINKDLFDGDERLTQHNPAGVLAHELGHSLGPFGDTKASTTEVEQAFQWQDASPHEKNPIRKQWQKANHHPMDEANRASANLNEDFAETYRNLIGVPMHAEHNNTKPSSRWHWKDQNSSRRKFMVKYHLRSTATQGDNI
jgi:hypothetical protein